MPTENGVIYCEECGMDMKNDAWRKIKAEGWFFKKNGEAYCPDDIPDWVEEWRKNNAKQKESIDKHDALVEEITKAFFPDSKELTPRETRKVMQAYSNITDKFYFTLKKGKKK